MPILIVIYPQISIFSVFKIVSYSPYWLQLKFSMSLFQRIWLFFYLFTFAINLWHRKFITADVTAVFVNNQHCMKWREQDFDKNAYIQSVQIVTRVKKLKSVHLKCNFLHFLPYVMNICPKYEFFISQGSVATCLRWGGSVTWVL